jgi:hypothetical protein
MRRLQVCAVRWRYAARHFKTRYCRRSPPVLLRGASFVALGTQVSASLHPLVEHPYDLHDARPNDTVE